MSAHNITEVKTDSENALAMPRKCPACGARLTAQSVTCEYCGSSTLPVAFSVCQREEVRWLAKELNGQLETKSGLLTQKFHRNLWISLSAYILLGVFMQFAFRVSIGWVFVVPFLCAVITFIVLRRLNQTARVSAFITIYFETLEPQINAFIHTKSIPRWQFDNLADAELDKAALLHLFLAGKPVHRKR
jgi:hypothetical protein